MKTFTTITNYEFYQMLLDDAQTGETEWSINKKARSGDIVLLYVCAPVSAIVARAIVSDDPYEMTEINSEWFGTWFAKMEDLTMLEKPLTRSELCDLFPDWGYWKQPRNSIAAPSDYDVKLNCLILDRLPLRPVGDLNFVLTNYFAPCGNCSGLGKEPFEQEEQVCAKCGGTGHGELIRDKLLSEAKVSHKKLADYKKEVLIDYILETGFLGDEVDFNRLETIRKKIDFGELVAIDGQLQLEIERAEKRPESPENIDEFIRLVRKRLKNFDRMKKVYAK